jgi:hypothetical protein
VAAAGRIANPLRDKGLSAMGFPRVSDKLIDYLSRNKNMNVTLTELVEATGLDKKQISNALGTLRTRYGLDIQTIMTGNVWKYRGGGIPEPVPPVVEPAPAPPAAVTTAAGVTTSNTGRVFELLAVSNSGTLVIQDEDGKLYRASEL